MSLLGSAYCQMATSYYFIKGIDAGLLFSLLKLRCYLPLMGLIFVKILLFSNGQGLPSGGKPPTEAPSSSCPLNISVLDKYPYIEQQAKLQGNQRAQCSALHEGLNLLVAVYALQTGDFLLNSSLAELCIHDIEARLSSQGSNISINELCAFGSDILEQGSTRCPNFVKVSDLMAAIPGTLLENVNSTCMVDLESFASCSSCTAAVVNAVVYNTTHPCLDYTTIYAAVINTDGPSDESTANCLFLGGSSNSKEHFPTYAIYLIAALGSLLLCCLSTLLILFLWRRSAAAKRRAGIASSLSESGPSRRPATGVCYEMGEIKEATENFSRSSIIGSGGFGNVYKGILRDGTEIAVKRFKDCSASGDPEFVHEVEMLSSVRHRNLVPLVGWCVGNSPSEGHQRIIVFEYMPNGSLQEHISGKAKPSLDWPTRVRIAIGMARGIAYLHNGAQPAIIHRDIKPSNILLDLHFNARVSDFGLARFAPEGVTHMSTGVAGTRGYVAPEYFMYRQLTDKSDVYSFGIVLLELLTGRSTLVSGLPEFSRPIPLADWVCFMYRAGRMKETLDQSMQNLGPEEMIERYILVALLCSHTQVSCRPSMIQALKLLEDDAPLPVLPDWSTPLTLDASEIEQVVGSPVIFSSKGGHQPFSSDGDLPR